MYRTVIVIALVLSSGCASRSLPREVRLKQDVLTAIGALEVLAKSVEAATDAKVLTNAQANFVWDIELAAIRTLKATNGNAWAVLRVALEQMEQLPFAERIRPYVGVAKLTLAAIAPPTPVAQKQLRREALDLIFVTHSSHWPQTWRPCVTVYSGCGTPQGAY